MQTEHGTQLGFDDGCRCDDCVYADKFTTLQWSVEEPAFRDVRVFHPLKKSKSRMFPARDLVLVLRQPNSRVLAEVLETAPSTVTKWLREGTCWTVYEADRRALKAGVHPYFVWGDKFFEGADELA